MTRRTRPVIEIPAAPNLEYECQLWDRGVQMVAGVDEAGRGAWAGPVVAAMVIFPNENNLAQVLFGVRDSKQINAEKRAYWAGIIQEQALAWGVGFSDHSEIDQIGILPATRLAMQRALERLTIPAQHLLIDAVVLPKNTVPQTALIKGDQRSLSIAAASILAKTTRDAFMQQEETSYPGYGFTRHKGYGTRFHQAALKELGPCPIHRMSFRPLREQS